jgi:hypothetical protein
MTIGERDRKAIKAGRRAMLELREIEGKFRARKSVMMIAARGLYQARCKYHDNRDLGRWLERSPYASLRPHEIASMLNLARNERQLAPFLKLHHRLLSRRALASGPQVRWGARRCHHQSRRDQ